MYVVTIPNGWHRGLNGFSVNEFKDWLITNSLNETCWHFKVLPDDALEITLVHEQDAVAFKLKFYNTNREP